MDSSSFLQTPSIKTVIFMDSKRLCTESLGDLVRGTNCPRHESPITPLVDKMF